MKKILTVVAAAGLVAVAACSSETPNAAVENTVESLEANAAAYQSAADNATNEAVETVLENAADVAQNAADAVAANAN